MRIEQDSKDGQGQRCVVAKKKAMVFEKTLCPKKKVPWDTVEWVERSAIINDETGKPVFEQKNIEAPATWSRTAVNVVAAKYFRGHMDDPSRESSIRGLIDRVSSTIKNWGLKDGYFKDTASADNFYDDLTYALLHQMVSFNSPVWFNVGVKGSPNQCSACFIQSVEDDMRSIMELAKNEAMLFKGGSGTGSNLSKLRGSKEGLSGGGRASGPVSFMKGFDAFAGVIKSGGKTRRAAKMVILDVDHPDILEFIRCKAEEEKKAHALIAQGYPADFNGPAYDSIHFQNANHSIRVSDEFMESVLNRGKFATRARRDGSVVEELDARELLMEAAKAAWECGDPGIQFDTTINKWHTCSNTDRIYGSNPCSEYMFLDNTACNLASINLLKFRTESGKFRTPDFCNLVRVMITAMEIIVGNSNYPTAKIAENSYKYRPLGLGFSNLGAYLMCQGLPYDSDEGRSFAAGVTALLCGKAYETSAEIAKGSGPFEAWDTNKEPFMGVLRRHTEAAKALKNQDPEMHEATVAAWENTLAMAEETGVRNAQATVLAPTGTISFMMDCATTGIEPDIALVKYKKLVGGGTMKLVNTNVNLALSSLGYGDKQIKDIVQYIDEHETIEGAPGLLDEHLPVFDCAFKASNGTRTISPMGHVRMMEACQPFLSGAISKTVNMPQDSTVEDIFNIFIEAWKRGLKAIAVYRDGCKQSQPLSTTKTKTKSSDAPQSEDNHPKRRILPPERQSITHKFSIGGQSGYITVGLYEDGTPGEIFLRMSKEGSTISGLVDSFAVALSLGLQYGVPLSVLVKRFSYTRFEPSGITNNPDIRIAKSIVDYLFRWLGNKFLERKGVKGEESGDSSSAASSSTLTGPPCPDCGTITVRAGSCHTCPACGSTTGCG